MSSTPLYTVGVLALQGAFSEHLEYLAEASQLPRLAKHQFEFLAVRTPQQLQKCHALVVPGGESTSMSLIAERTGMLQPLVEFARNRPVWGTCAGLIFLASEICNGRPHQKALGAMSIRVTRNAFGRQLDLFDAPRDFGSFAPGLGEFRTVFIRAPVVSGPFSILENGLVVAVRQGNILGTLFHPELSGDCRFHGWFLEEFVVPAHC
ncbi:SNO glutamine amidotransferase [Metschnikowia bicuspidata var. bicuspidata NRRL YB-4993]|uniref:glutaminase n=1 Tax=Metschnikowia bicuspidata var. bicuspidata NRRL YB-4993 TaxID=869754 RepID=A0A1A0HI34_9ASCO|nr:SNO glutamine amidotransferase [Metschnikowia bicuspidata var. bicuspidata NRRL YB-4993]OBA23824.1 SNO glutamine amidotransferase [Metschnikowia bicuspidata var. bicuspidata NRRL YB-4993]